MMLVLYMWVPIAFPHLTMAERRPSSSAFPHYYCRDFFFSLGKVQAKSTHVVPAQLHLIPFILIFYHSSSVSGKKDKSYCLFSVTLAKYLGSQLQRFQCMVRGSCWLMGGSTTWLECVAEQNCSPRDICKQALERPRSQCSLQGHHSLPTFLPLGPKKKASTENIETSIFVQYGVGAPTEAIPCIMSITKD